MQTGSDLQKLCTSLAYMVVSQILSAEPSLYKASYVTGAQLLSNPAEGRGRMKKQQWSVPYLSAEVC